MQLSPVVPKYNCTNLGWVGQNPAPTESIFPNGIVGIQSASLLEWSYKLTNGVTATKRLLTTLTGSKLVMGNLPALVLATLLGCAQTTENFQSFHSTNQTGRYNEANSMNQSRYNEAQSMQNQHYQNESALSHQQYNQASNLQSNSNRYWGDPYGGCCGSSGGSGAGAAALGMVGGMAMGATMESAMQPRQSTTIVENAAPPLQYAAPLPYLPPGATPTQMNGSEYFYSNGTYYKPEFNGSQVVYVPSPG